MSQLEEFIRGLFSTSEWPARWHCGYWSDLHGWIYIVSELLIWIAYFLIPLIILNYLTKKKAKLRFNRAYLYFSAFILLCGATHFLDALMFWIPMYRLNAVIRMATALVSLATVYHLMRILPDLFTQRTSLELEREVARRRAAEKELENANQSLQAFVYAASHDLQEPLRKVRTYIDRVVTREEGQLSAKTQVDLEKTQAAAARMQSLVKDLLVLYGIRADKPLQPVDPAIPLRDALDLLELRIQEKSAHISIGTLPNIMGNGEYLVHVFYNLVGNALKFCTHEPVVQISGYEAEAHAVIKISDNGIGIPPEARARIFEPFQRVATGQRFEGSGVGLSIVKKIVELHGGSIEVESEPGTGTTFILTFAGVRQMS